MDERKYIIGWLSFPLGNREAFLEKVAPYVLECRKEPGCMFFEMNPCLIDEDQVTLSECFASASIHDEHLERPHVKAFFDVLSEFGAKGRFENIFPARVEPDSAEF